MLITPATAEPPSSPPHSSGGSVTSPPLDLAEGLRRSGMTHEQLWVRYFGLGGDGTSEQLRRHLDNNHCPDTHEHNIIAQALNDAFVEQGGDHPVAYRHLYRGDADD